jgi:hypothetical protein
MKPSDGWLAVGMVIAPWLAILGAVAVIGSCEGV